jgi:hypothetical protein
MQVNSTADDGIMRRKLSAVDNFLSFRAAADESLDADNEEQ